MYISKTTVAFLLQSGASLAAVVNVNVGGNQQLTFSPQQVKAAAGDTVRFTFLDQNHTVTSGNPTQGCKPSGKFNSGFVPVAANQGTKPTFDVAVQNTQPITVYCAQAQHCQVGMVMVINPTATGATSVNAYKALSAKAKTNTPAQGVNGGTLKNAQPAATTAKGKKAGGAKKAGKAAKAAGKAAGGKKAAKKVAKDKEPPKIVVKPTIKYGLNHVTHLVEQKTAQLVVIAHDVDPIELVIHLPALCRKLEVPYCIVKGKSRLGLVVRKKTATCVALTSVKKEHQKQLDALKQICLEQFNSNKEIPKTWGGKQLGRRTLSLLRKQNKLPPVGTAQ